MPRKAMKSVYNVFEMVDMQSGDTDSCWPFKGALSGTDGRPYITVDGKKLLAYRVIFELTFGVTLERKDVLLHQCDHPWCCNPHHLHRGDHAQNMKDMSAKGRGKNGRQDALPLEAIKLIRKRLKEGFKHPHIAMDVLEQFGIPISRSVVTHINNDLSYRGVGLLEPDVQLDKKHN